MAILKDLAELVQGTLVGDGDIEIRRVAPITEAAEGEITFIANPKYLAKLKNTRASAVILPTAVDEGRFAQIVCPNPYLAFAKILTFLQVKKPAAQGVMEGARVAASANIGEDVTIHPGCVVGEGVAIGKGTILYPGVVVYDDVTLGEDCVIHAQVSIREGSRIGNRVIVQPSAVIGSDGFGYAPDGRQYFKIPQVGIVVLEDDVEIGAGSCIDRAAMGQTLIRRGTKIDNLVQVGHNTVVGEDTIIVSQVGISGSTTIGDHCTFGGQSAAAGHLKIGDNVTIAGRGGVTKDVASGQILSGLPLMPHKEWLKASMSFGKLPEMRKEISRLKKQLEALEMSVKEK